MMLEKVEGNINSLVRDQYGCRFLQKQFENCIFYEVYVIYWEVLFYVYEFMIDFFGNYFCQKFFEYCIDDECIELIKNLVKDMVLIVLN